MSTLSNCSLLSLFRCSIVIASSVVFYGCAQSTDVTKEVISEDKPADIIVQELFSPEKLMEKDQAGVDMLIVSKNNDFVVELDFEGEFSVLNTVEETTFSVPASKVELSDNPNLFRYITEGKEDSLAIQFHKTECMTEFVRKMDHEVAVDFTNKKSEQSTTFYGCAEYIPDFTLHNTWRVTELNGEPLSTDDFVRNFPFFEFNMVTKTVIGNDGCNRISADIIVDHQKVGFGLFMGTKMACVKMDKGEQITTALSNKKFDYQLDENRLILSQGGEDILVLQAAE